jgi:heterodisulfide reductase subunit D
VKQKKLKPTHPINAVVTYHDPCHLGRHGHIFDAPREILKSIPGITLVEMNRIREYSFCCGGGGGARTGKLEFAQATAQRRVQEAEDTGAEFLVTACPFCEQNFLDYMDTTGSQLKLVDVVALLKQSVLGETEQKKKKKKEAR